MSRTEVAIDGDCFKINGEYTYSGRRWKDIKIEGLLFNSRMVQGIFDDRNPETVDHWAYPDTGKWDPERNTREFLQAMPEWRRKGLLSFTINLQGGNPRGYSRQQPWYNSAILADGQLDPDYMGRLERILDRADQLGMAVILGYFYFGQDQLLEDEDAIRKATFSITDWLLERDYRHLLIEANNECDNRKYTHSILKEDRIDEVMEFIRERSGGRLPVSASFCGRVIPTDNVIQSADFILLHGNGVEDPDCISEMVEEVRHKAVYRGQPILFNEDDHFNFESSKNNMLEAVRSGASWGFFDPGENNYRDGYQSPPVNWGINTPRKKAFFSKVAELTGCS